MYALLVVVVIPALRVKLDFIKKPQELKLAQSVVKAEPLLLKDQLPLEIVSLACFECQYSML